MFSEYRDYILNVRNSLIRNGIELDVDPTDDYEKLFYLGEGLGQILWLYNIFGRVGDDLALSDTLLPLNDTYDQKIRRRVFEKFCENEVDLRVANEGYNKDEIIDLWGTVEKEKPVEVVGTVENVPTPLKEKLSQMLSKFNKKEESVRIVENSENTSAPLKENSRIEEKSDDRYIRSDDFGDYEWIFERARALDGAKKPQTKGSRVADHGSDEKIYVDVDDLLNTGDGWVCDMVGHKFVIERPVVFGGNVSDEKPTWDDSDDDWSSDPEEGSEEEGSEWDTEEDNSEEEGSDDSDLFAEWDTSDDEDSESDVDEDSESEDDFGDNWGDDDEESEDEGSEDRGSSEKDTTESSEKGFDDWGSSEDDDDDFSDWGSDDEENGNSDLDKWVDSSTGNTPTGFNSGSESKDTVRRSLSPEDLALEKEIARIDESVEKVSNLISKGFSTLRKLPKKAMKDMGKTE